MRTTYSFSFEARSLIYEIQGKALIDGRKLTYGDAIAEAVENVRQYMASNRIDWFKVRDFGELPAAIFVNGDSASKRYQTHINVPDADAEWLEQLRKNLKTEFRGITRSVYIPYVIWLVLKANWMITNGYTHEM